MVGPVLLLVYRPWRALRSWRFDLQRGGRGKRHKVSADSTQPSIYLQ
jgi:hypothetical protein